MDRPQWLRLVATKVTRPYSFRFLFVGMDEKQSLQRKVNTRDELVAHIMNNAALIKQERQDYLKRATHTICKES
jgi:hypothetical protein